MQISRRKKIVIVSVAVIGLVAIVSLSRVIRPREGEAVQVGKVERRQLLESKVTASGDVRPVRYYDLQAEVAGRVEQIYVNEGDVVKRNQPLVRVDPTQLSSQVSAYESGVRVNQSEAANQQVAIQQAKSTIHQIRATLNGAQFDLDRNKADLQFAENEFNRYQQLVEAGLVTKSQFDSVKSQYEQRRAVVRSSESRVAQLKAQVEEAELGVKRQESGYESAQARVKQAQAQLDIQADQLKKTTKFSPIDGVVSYLPVKVGQYAVANFSVTPLLTVADMSQINSEIKVDETDIADVQVGQKAKVKVDALGDIEIDGEVIEKGASAITRSGQATTSQSATSQEARDFLVKIKLMPTEEIRVKLRPGMSTTATITTATVENVLVVPLQSIVPRELPKEEGQEEAQELPNGKKREVEGVFVLGSDGKAHFNKVETGIKGDQDIELKSGVNEGEEIIIGPYKTLRTLKDSDPVKKEAKPATGAEDKK
jgi:HlyD family secretion protein